MVEPCRHPCSVRTKEGWHCPDCNLISQEPMVLEQRSTAPTPWASHKRQRYMATIPEAINTSDIGQEE